MKKTFLFILFSFFSISAFAIEDFSEVDCNGDNPQKKYKKARSLKNSTAKIMGRVYYALEEVDSETGIETPNYAKAKDLLSLFDTGFKFLPSYDKSVIHNTWGYLYIIDSDPHSAMESYLSVINEPDVTRGLRDASIKTCEKLKIIIKNLDEKDAKQAKIDAEKIDISKLGNWEMGFYVDEFGDVTTKGYIAQSLMGTFSNSATQNSSLRVRLFINNGNITTNDPWFRFYEYNRNLPLRGVYDSNPMSCKFKNSNGDIYNFKLDQGRGSDSLTIKRGGDSSTSLRLLKKFIQNEDLLKFSCVSDENRSRYQFKIDSKHYKNILYKFQNPKEDQVTKIEIEDSSELKNSDFDLFVLRVHVLSSLENAETIADASITLKVYSHFLEELTVDFDEYLPKIHA